MERNLIICDNLSPFSPTAYAVDCANNLLESGDVKFIQLQFRSLQEKQLPDIGRANLVDAIAFHQMTMPDRLDLGFMLRLRKVVNGFRPSEVHLFCEFPQTLLKALAFSRNENVTIHVAHRKPLSKTCFCSTSRWLKRKKIMWSVASNEIAQDLIAANIRSQNIVVERQVSPVEKISHKNLRSASSIKQMLGKAAGTGGDIRLISTVAPLKPQACLRDLIWAVELLKAIRDDVHVAIIGDNFFDNDQHILQLKRFIDATALGKQVHFTGWTENAADIIAASDVYCEPSDWQPNSRALQFAIQSGVPTAIVESSFSKRNFSDGVDCLMFPHGEKNELGRRLRRLIDDQVLSQQIAVAAKQQKSKFAA